MNRQLFSGEPDWSGCRTMLGLNKADASKEYSLRKYAPISRRCEHVAQLLRRCFGIKPKYPADDIVRSNFIG
jgi:hypothetical protein